MPKIKVHSDDLPKWAVRKTKLPSTLLGHLREAAYPAPDGSKMISIEDIMLRQHWEGMLTGNRVARDWLLRKVIKDKKAELDACPERPTVAIEGVHYFRPLSTVMAILGCAVVREPAKGSDEPSTIEFVPSFLDALTEHCPPEKLAPVVAWQDAGGRQEPRIRDRDRHD